MKRLANVLIVTAFACTLFAQNDRVAEVQGQVIDMLGRPVAGGEVVYRNVDIARVYRTRTGKNGKFDIVGVMLGTYQVEITGPTGEHILSTKRSVFDGDQQVLNAIHVDLSIVPTRASLAPFKGPSAQQIEGETWRKVQDHTLTKAEMAELREENAAFVHYNEVASEAKAAIKTQEWPRAQELLGQLAAIAPYMWQVYQNLGTIASNRGLYAEAVAAYEKGIQVVEYDDALSKDRQRLNLVRAQMLIGEGEAYGAWGQLDSAANEYRKAAEIDPHPALAYIHLCVAEYNTGHAGAALDDCATGIAADPRHSEFYQILGGIQMNLEKYREAIAIYDKGARLALATLEVVRNSTRSTVPLPADAYSITAMEQTLTRQMMPEGEGSAFYKSRAGQMLLSEGNAYFQLRKFKQAADLFARAAKLHEYPALAYFNLCATRFDLGEWKAAVEACDRAIAGDSGMADAYYAKAAALFGEGARQGKFKATQEALSALQAYLELDPNGSHSREVQAMLGEIPAKR
ncbi:MAG TPA: tetratricopeptide repeat protein [Terriglobales bacterium]